MLTAALEGVATREAHLSELLSAKLGNGRSVPSRAGGFPVLRLTALRDGRIDLNERKEGDWSADQAVRFLVRKGDFLIARGNGSLDLVGRGGLVAEDPDPVAFPDTMIRASPDLSQLSPEFLALLWHSRDVRRQIESAARTTAGIFKVNQKDLGGVRLTIPALEDQKRIAATVSDQRSALARLHQDIDLARLRATTLRRALLAAAFSGRLTGSASDEDRVEELVDA